MHDLNGRTIVQPRPVSLLPAAALMQMGLAIHLKLPISFETADDEVLFTVPENMPLALRRLWWQITANFDGGTNSAIGVAGDTAPHETAGDLLGGAGGDVAATLVASGGHVGGTIGASFGTNGVVVLQPGENLVFNRVVDAFTEGTGFVHVLADWIQ